jgi:hypothetical protein
MIRFPAMRKLRSSDQNWFNRKAPAMLDTLKRFLEIEGQMRATKNFNGEELARCIDKLRRLDFFDFQYLKNDDNGYCVVTWHEMKLLDRKPDRINLRHWWNRYETGLRNHALKSYTSDPFSLHKALRERLERHWKSESQLGLGAMGHAPAGHIYTPHGPDTPNEVLLELHTSKLAGWIGAIAIRLCCSLIARRSTTAISAPSVAT